MCRQPFRAVRELSRRETGGELEMRAAGDSNTDNIARPQQHSTTQHCQLPANRLRTLHVLLSANVRKPCVQCVLCMCECSRVYCMVCVCESERVCNVSFECCARSGEPVALQFAV